MLENPLAVVIIMLLVTLTKLVFYTPQQHTI